MSNRERTLLMTRKSALPLGLLALIPAAVLLLCALFIPMAPWVQLVLCLLSFLAAFFPLALPVWRELLREKRPGYPLLLAAACLIHAPVPPGDPGPGLAPDPGGERGQPTA